MKPLIDKVEREEISILFTALDSANRSILSNMAQECFSKQENDKRLSPELDYKSTHE